MMIEWKVDSVLNKAIWGRLWTLPRELMGDANPRIVLDLGGGIGDFGSELKSEVTTVITLDSDIELLRSRIEGLQAVLGDAKNLPFKDSSIDGVTARAILHHFPESLPECLEEVKRVLKDGGRLLTQEPLAHNYLANMARKYFSTERHEIGERPLDPVSLAKTIGDRYYLEWMEHHFLLSYLLPHLVFRLPRPLKGLGRFVGRILSNLDEKVLKTMPKLRKHAAYMTVLAAKRPRYHPTEIGNPKD